MSQIKSWKTLFWLFLTGLGIRILYYLLFSNELIIGNDAYEYIKLSQKFAAGDFYGMLHPYWPPLYPFLLGIISIFTKSQIYPAIIVSIITGSLIVPITYYLVKQSYGNREALTAALIAMLYPHLLNSVYEIGTENVYILLVIGSLIAGWKAVQLNSPKNFFITGILIGLAYLTRPEAFGYIFFFSFLIIYKGVHSKKLIIKNSSARLAVLLLGFSLLAAPYIFYLRESTGSWTISAKVNNNLAAGNYSEISLSPSSRILPSGASMEKSAKVISKAFFSNAYNFHKLLPFLLPPLSLMLIAVGLFRGAWSKERFKRESFLLLFCFLTILGYLLAVVEVSYFYVLLPIFIGWMARGMLEIEDWFIESGQHFLPDKYLFILRRPIIVILIFVLLNLYLLPLNNFMRPREAAWQFSRYEQRDAGLWLKENAPPAPVIMSRDFRPAFYAAGQRIPLNSSTLSEILTQAKENNADYLVFDERNMKEAQELRTLVDGSETVSELKLIYQANAQTGYKISIYQVNK